jgi:hypothetical protein
MKPIGNCGAIAAIAAGWLLLMPPFSVTPAGKTFIDASAPLYRWEILSSHSDNTDCLKHRDKLREQLKQASSSAAPAKTEGKSGDKAQAAFAGLRARLGSARCISSTDPRLHPPSPTISKGK